MIRRNLIPLMIALVLSATIIGADYFVGQVQRHFGFVTGWIGVVALVFLILGLRRDDRNLKISEINGFQKRFSYTLSLFLVLATSLLIHHDYGIPKGIFGGFLLSLFTLTLVTGVILRRAEYRLLLAVENLGDRAEVIRAETLDRYSRARCLHAGFVFATLPVAFLNGILNHAHGALSNLVDKGAA